jgi:hypothetical protein
MDKPICMKLGMLVLGDQEEILERSKLRRIVLSSSPGEGVSSSPEANNDKRTAPRPKLFGRGNYKNEGHNLEEFVLVSKPDEIFL